MRSNLINNTSKRKYICRRTIRLLHSNLRGFISDSPIKSIYRNFWI